ncbi:hypothetical protein CTAYLR_009780 [Chrysophaeum taylorii]|uniref:Uncharacterized protein n=1 Tax=Chrysophaeum taylorii TaxID=2483200 RepID=A0AAD7UF34_9STRA|nr:hypothetical protein CTAYLR_009780 [Chrysophaeum taylorii]
MLLLLLCGVVRGFVVVPQRAPRPSSSPAATVSAEEVMQCLRREYRSFFDPLEPSFYLDSVTFEDPLNSLSGLDAYRGNVDMLAGRTPLGNLLFQDAAIALHSVAPTGEYSLRTRWTLRVTFRALPWQPVARFTGISDYDLDKATGKIAAQRDYWDSIDLRGDDAYSRSSRVDAIKDFSNQLFGGGGGGGTLDTELPFELLRRAKGYSVRRYPPCVYACVDYDSRPEGYDVLGSYAGGSNVADERLSPFVPSIIRVPRRARGPKTMRWPMDIADRATLPEPSATAVSLRTETKPLVVAVLAFKEAATQGAADYYTRALEKFLDDDNLTREQGADDVYQIAQFDAIFSVGDRRNEVWIPILEPDYWRTPP